MDELHYDAFISYRHTPRDIEVAKEIQHSLEHFRIPKAIREKTHIEKISRIFRDQEELQLNADLAANIESALNNSDNLIVICSPSYLESKWCLLEIDTFLKNHDRDHIFCVLSEGEPPAVFPTQLCHYTKTVTDEDGSEKTITVDSEPLACDYRMDFKDARKIELPRLVSSMIGCNYDELVLRQEKYRRKRLFTILGSLFLMAIIAISYLLWSNAQISRNYRQAQINESKVLAKESLDYYANQDRLSAIRTVLKALPSEENDRPITDEALYALAETTYAYAVPFSTEELWRIDEINEITSFFITRDSRYLVYLDKGNELHTVELGSHKELISVPLSAVPNNIHEGKKDEVIVCFNDEIESFSYVSGEKIWSVPLVNKTLGKSALSSTGELIGLIDSYKVSILDNDGNEKSSFELSEDSESYISDLAWNRSDSQLALMLRGSQTEYNIALYDPESSELSVLDENFNNIIYFGFDDKDTLYVVDDPGGLSSYDMINFSSVVNKKYQLSAYSGVNKKYETAIDNSFAPKDVEIIGHDEESVCLILGNGIYQIDEAGNILNSYQMNSSISKVLSYDSQTIIYACTDGYLGTFYFGNGTASLIRSFPKNFTDIQKIMSRLNAMFSHFAVLYDGDIYLYEYVYDDSLEYYTMNTHEYPPDEHLLSGDKLIYAAYDTIGVADLNDSRVIGTCKLEENSYYHLLDVIDDTAYLLKATAPEGNLSIVSFDMLDQKIKDEKELGIYDVEIVYNLTYGIYSLPFSWQEKIDINYNYVYPSALICKDHVLYYHDYEQPNLIRILDLQTGETKEADIDPDGRVMIMLDGKMVLPSELLLDEENGYLLTSALGKGADRCGVLIDLNSNETIILEEDSEDDFLASIGDNMAIISNSYSIDVYNYQGELQYRIPYTSEKAMAFTSHQGKIYCVYPDGTLKIYQGENEVRSIELSDKGDFYSSKKMIRFEFIDQELFLYNDEVLYVIDLDSDSSRPLLEVNGNVLDYYKDKNEFLVYAYELKKLDLTYALASYKRYSIEELIERANEQLNNY